MIEGLSNIEAFWIAALVLAFTAYAVFGSES